MGPQKPGFCSKINCSQMKLQYFVNWHSVGPTKIGPNFRKLSGSKIESRKRCVSKKCSPKLIFLDEIFFKKIRLIFDIENWLWKYNLGTFWGPGTMSIYKIKQFPLNTVDFWAKTLLFMTYQARNSMT